MPKEQKKDFYKVADLTKVFEAFRANLGGEAFNWPEIDRKTKVHFNLIVWQIEAQLAIAQQLTVISGHLGEIVGKSKVAE